MSTTPDPVTPDPSSANAARSQRLFVRGMAFSIIALIVVVGAVIFWMSRRTGPATEQSKAFIQDLINGNLDSAKSRCTGNIDFDEMARLADKQTGKMRFWGKLTGQSFVERSQADRADVDGSLTFEQLSKTFSATLRKQPDGKYLITTYSFN